MVSETPYAFLFSEQSAVVAGARLERVERVSSAQVIVGQAFLPADWIRAGRQAGMLALQ